MSSDQAPQCVAAMLQILAPPHRAITFIYSDHIPIFMSQQLNALVLCQIFNHRLAIMKEACILKVTELHKSPNCALMLAGPIEMDDEAAVKIHNIIGRLPVLTKACLSPKGKSFSGLRADQEKVEPRM